MNRKTSFAASLATIIALATPAGAQRHAGPTVLTVHPVKDGIYWVSGGVSNTGFIVGDQGVVVIDAQTSPDDAKLALAEIAKVTPKPVNEIVLTHADPDHVGGLPAYPPGAGIIAQENTTSIINASIADPNGGPYFGPLYRALENYKPTQTVAGKQDVAFDGVQMRLIHVAPAHTPADLAIYLPTERVVFGGDIITTNLGPFPVIHDGGSSQGWIDFMTALLALDADTYVSGHGPMETKAMLQDRLRAAQQRRDDVKAMVNQGKSWEEIDQALPEKPLDPRFATYTKVIYEELTKGYPGAARSPWAGLIRQQK